MVTFESLQEKHGDGVLAVFNYCIRTSNFAYPRDEVADEFFDVFLENAQNLSE